MDDKIDIDYYNSPFSISQLQTVKHAQTMDYSIAQIKMFKTLATATMKMIIINIMKWCKEYACQLMLIVDR